MAEMRIIYKILVRKPERKRPNGRLRPRSVYNIKMDLKVIAYEGVGWIHLARDMDPLWALVKAAMNLWVS
jgi:hypothetical protein